VPGGKKVVKNDYRSSAKHVFSITPATLISLIPSVATAPPGTFAWLRRPAGLPKSGFCCLLGLTCERPGTQRFADNEEVHGSSPCSPTDYA
jgi:hypothetical protein